MKTCIPLLCLTVLLSAGLPACAHSSMNAALERTQWEPWHLPLTLLDGAMRALLPINIRGDVRAKQSAAFWDGAP